MDTYLYPLFSKSSSLRTDEHWVTPTPERWQYEQPRTSLTAKLPTTLKPVIAASLRGLSSQVNPEQNEENTFLVLSSSFFVTRSKRKKKLVRWRSRGGRKKRNGRCMTNCLCKSTEDIPPTCSRARMLQTLDRRRTRRGRRTILLQACCHPNKRHFPPFYK